MFWVSPYGREHTLNQAVGKQRLAQAVVVVEEVRAVLAEASLGELAQRSAQTVIQLVAPTLIDGLERLHECADPRCLQRLFHTQASHRGAFRNLFQEMAYILIFQLSTCLV